MPTIKQRINFHMEITQQLYQIILLQGHNPNLHIKRITQQLSILNLSIKCINLIKYFHLVYQITYLVRTLILHMIYIKVSIQHMWLI
jgi:hypothetical protein